MGDKNNAKVDSVHNEGNIEINKSDTTENGNETTYTGTVNFAHITDIAKLRKMTGAGMMDCKKALEETNNDIEAAIEIIRAKGQAVAAKRSDREASEGCVLCKAENGFAAIIALKCETDFVANNADFVKLTKDILDLAIANKCKTLDEVKELTLGKVTVVQAVVDRTGITGEKMELDGYMTLEGDNISVYNHQNKNTLCTMVSLSAPVAEEYGHAYSPP